MPVYQCNDCGYEVWYAAPPTGQAARCEQCGAPLEYAHADPVATASPPQPKRPAMPSKKATPPDSSMDEAEKDKTLLIVGLGMPIVILFLAVVFGLIRQQISWSMGFSPTSLAGRRFGHEHTWFTFAGTEAVLLGLSGICWAAGFHMTGFWRIITGKRYWNWLAGVAYIMGVGFIIVAMLYKGQAH